MHLTFDFTTIITLMGVLQGLFLSLAVFRNRKGNRKANRFLALLLLFFSLSISNIVLFKTGMYNVVPFTIKIPTNITFLFGPFFYFYIQHLINQEYKLSPKSWLHFLPALLIALCFLPFYLQDSHVKRAYVTTITHNLIYDAKYYDILIILSLATIHIGSYLIVIRQLLKKHVLKLKGYFSNIEEKNLDWVKYFINASMIVFILVIPLIYLIIRSNRFLTAFNALGIIVSIAIYAVGYQGLKQTAIFSPMEQKANNRNPSSSRLSSYLSQIHRLMVEEKLYTDPELNLDALAKRLAISKGLLSQILNDEIGLSFYDYVNQFRVDEVKRQLLESANSHLTIMALAAESGFNSKTSFNRTFKRYTQMTPSEFIRRHRKTTIYKPNKGK